MINIPKGLYEVITSDRITLKEKSEAIRLFAEDVVNLDADPPYVEEAPITKEDAELIIEALEQGNLVEQRGK